MNFTTEEYSYWLANVKNKNTLEVKVKEIDFKGSTSTLNLLSKNSNTNIKLQNISSNISKSLSEDSLVYIEFNENTGNIFLKWN